MSQKNASQLTQSMANSAKKSPFMEQEFKANLLKDDSEFDTETAFKCLAYLKKLTIQLKEDLIENENDVENIQKNLNRLTYETNAFLKDFSEDTNQKLNTQQQQNQQIILEERQQNNEAQNECTTLKKQHRQLEQELIDCLKKSIILEDDVGRFNQKKAEEKTWEQLTSSKKQNKQQFQ